MVIMKPYVDYQSAVQLIERNTLTQDIRHQISSVSFGTTLSDHIGDFKQGELPEVYLIESKNLYRLINAVAMVLRIYNSSEMFYSSPEVVMALKIAREEVSDEKDRKKIIFSMLTKYCLSIISGNERMSAKPKLYGTLPKKFFAFRQDEGDKWFDYYVNFVLSIASEFLVKCDETSAFNFVISNTAWYLNRSQTFKYYKKSSDSNDNDTIYRIMNEFFDEVGGNKEHLNVNKTVPFFKDL